ncbi:MAG: lysophospholipid acyltransferase family protein [Mycobacteriales bacterium]
MHALWRVRVHGVAHIPTTGPVLLAGNHSGILDGPLLYGISPRPVHALAKEEVFVGPLRTLLLAIGQIPVDRTALLDVAALRACLGVLNQDRVLAVYPEGSRGTGDFATIRDGVAWLALRSGAPVVPVAAFGVRRSDGRVTVPPRPGTRVDVFFGRPFTVTAAEPWGPILPRRVVATAGRDIHRRLRAHHAEAAAFLAQLLGLTLMPDLTGVPDLAGGQPRRR